MHVLIIVISSKTWNVGLLLLLEWVTIYYCRIVGLNFVAVVITTVLVFYTLCP